MKNRENLESQPTDLFSQKELCVKFEESGIGVMATD